jgi:hypothetical protein
VIFGKKNQRDTMAEAATSPEGAPPYPGRAWQACGSPVGRLGVYFGHKEANIRIKIPSKFQPNRSYESPDIKETVFGQKQERETEEK